MSRRKQENPQPRKRLLSSEVELLQDTLTCGVCQKDFALSDIVKFIQHKVHHCNKENCHLYGDGSPDFESDLDKDDRALVVVGSKRPSISAPINKKNMDESHHRRHHHHAHHHLHHYNKDKSISSLLRSPSASFGETNFLNDDAERESNSRCASPTGSEDPLRRRSDGNESTRLTQSPRPKQVADADTNTTISEPNSYVCSTCKQTFGSAWVLVQHVQNMHGLKIYVDCSATGGGSSSSSPSSSLPPAAPSVVISGQESTSLPQPLTLDPTPSSALQLLRMPLSERQFGPSLNTHNVFPRPSSHDLRMELLGDQFPRMNHSGLGLSPFDNHHTFERGHFDRPPRAPAIGLGYEPQMDFYSQRLRQLAGATSPNSSSSPRKVTPPFSNPPPSLSIQSSSSQPPTPTSTPGQQQQQQLSSSVGGTKSSDQPGSPKLKSCEFCGKSFRFQSNLIVHRRSHTGEKPFKCHICNHACTQASKLKRHMKTHQNKSPGGSTISESASVESARSTPDSNAAKESHQANGGDEDGSDGQAGDNEEDEEELEEEDEIEEEEPESSSELQAEDLSTRGAPGSSTPVPGSCKSDKSDTSEKAERIPTRQSVLGEVMEKIGLSDIQQYNDAYRQALQESCAANSIKQERPSSSMELVARTSENGPSSRLLREEGSSKSQPTLDFGQGLLGAFDNPFDASKRFKLDLDHTRERNSLYAGLWLPPVTTSHRDFYLGLPHSDSELSRHKPSNESALMTAPSSGLGGSVSPRPGTSGSVASLLNNPAVGGPSAPTKQKERRNDTCEFCGRVFKNCSNLTVHRRSHTGEKPYKCELCSYACAQSSKLTRHMKTHGRVGKDVYRCRICDMPFSVPSTLEKHMRKCVVNQNASGALSEKDSDSKDLS